MKAITHIFAVLCAVILNTAVAAPVEVKPRAAAYFEGWSLPSWTGTYKKYDVNLNTCTIITAVFPPYTAAGLSSVKIGPVGGVECIIYSNTICNPGTDSDLGGDRLYVSSFHQDLDDPEIGWANKAMSFKCIAA